MKRSNYIAAILLASACGAPAELHKVTQPPAPPAPVVIAVFVELPAMYDGLPLTVSGPRSPESMPSPIDGMPAWEYEMSETEFDSAVIEILNYNPATSEGQLVGSVVPEQPATQLCSGHGLPQSVAYQITITDPSTGVPVTPEPKLLQIVCADGTKEAMTY